MSTRRVLRALVLSAMIAVAADVGRAERDAGIQPADPVASPGAAFIGHWALVDPALPAEEMAAAITVRREAVDNPSPPLARLVIERETQGGVQRTLVEPGMVRGLVAGAPAGHGVCDYRWSARATGDEMAMETRRPDGNGACIEHAETWRLDAAGHLTVRIRAAQPGLPEAVRTGTYRRQ